MIPLRFACPQCLSFFHSLRCPVELFGGSHWNDGRGWAFVPSAAERELPDEATKKVAEQEANINFPYSTLLGGVPSLLLIADEERRMGVRSGSDQAGVRNGVWENN